MARRIENRAKTARRSFRVLGVTVKFGLLPVGLVPVGLLPVGSGKCDRSSGRGVGPDDGPDDDSDDDSDDGSVDIVDA